jgi:hypothetical protein
VARIHPTPLWLRNDRRTVLRLAGLRRDTCIHTS